jgi:hypothetical protein
MNIRHGIIALMTVFLFACSSAAQESPIVENKESTASPTITRSPVTATSQPENTATFTPTITPAATLPNTEGINKTVLKFEFPFEPTIGYTVDITSETFTANLLCALGGESSGEVLDMNDNSKKWGICDKSSMSLDIGISDQITVTVILGGIPFINEETKSPSQITEQHIEYTFEVNLQ